MIFLIPALIAALVSISRLVDYRHHWDDILAGSLIGCAAAFTGFFYFYPLIFGKTCKHDEKKTLDGVSGNGVV